MAQSSSSLYRYDKEFKLAVLKCAQTTSNCEAAKQFRVPESTLRAWIKVRLLV